MKPLKKKEDILFQEIEALKNKFRKVEDESSVVKLDNIYEKMIAQVRQLPLLLLLLLLLW